LTNDPLGLGSLSAEDKISLLKHMYETLELWVGRRLTEQMTNQQLDEFQKIFTSDDKEGATS